MAKTRFLTPLSAVRLLWGATRGFTNDAIKDVYTDYIQPEIDKLLELTKDNDKEIRYIRQLGIQLTAAIRNAGIIYKGRQLNYNENKKLREAYLKSLEKDYDLTGQLKELLKSLPSIGIGGAGGIVLLQSSTQSPGTFEQLFVAFSFAGIAYLIQKLVEKALLYNKQMNYIRQDYETTLYYENYLSRMENALKELYENLEIIHEHIFEERYHEKEDVGELIKKMIQEVRPTRCPLIDKHMKSGKINPDYWHLCETGLPYAENCKLYNEK